MRADLSPMRRLFVFLWFSAFVGLLIGCLTSCNRRPRADIFQEAPNPPGDTVYVIRYIDMCNYKYISGDTVKAKKQLERCVKALGKLVIENDSIISKLRQRVRQQNAVINSLPQ